MNSFRLLLVALAVLFPAEDQPFLDKTHPSKVLGEDRHYRIFLPAGYETSGRRYPVIYYFHGHSDRYTLEKYDGGTDTVPKIAAFVANHPVIVVAVDGYVARNYSGFYGGEPWDAREAGGEFDFGRYFLELVAHTDGSYRTLTSRRYRAVSGLSMGGFMSFYLSARFPEWIGSASAFNPSSALYAGDKGRRVFWRLKDHTANHTHTMVRLVRASGDYMSQYHEELKEEYARARDVDFEYRQDEFHRHWATSIPETFEFHMRAFANPSLDNFPESFNHCDPYGDFDVWGWHVRWEAKEAGLLCLEDAGQGGLRVLTRRWSPEGPPIPGGKISIRTRSLYEPGAEYLLLDYAFESGSSIVNRVLADSEGRLTFQIDSGGHQVSFTGPGASAQPPILLPALLGGRLRVPPKEMTALPISIFNPRTVSMTGVQLSLTSDYPTVEIAGGRITIPEIKAGQAVDVSAQTRVRFTSGDGYFSHARLNLKITYDGWHEVSRDIDVCVAPEIIPDALEVAILDGRRMTFPVFRQKGNQGGGSSIQRTVAEGTGNGNGVLEPGEEATVWVRLKQGIDSFDKDNWHRAIVYSDSRWIEQVKLIEEDKQLEWSGAKERSSLIRLSKDTPSGTLLPLLLETESFSFYFTPDMRYGKEPLSQAFQIHRRQLHRFSIKVPLRSH